MTLCLLDVAGVFSAQVSRETPRELCPAWDIPIMASLHDVIVNVACQPLPSHLVVCSSEQTAELKSEVPSKLVAATGGAHFSHCVAFPPGDIEGSSTHEILMWAQGRCLAQGHGQGVSP